MFVFFKKRKIYLKKNRLKLLSLASYFISRLLLLCKTDMDTVTHTFFQSALEIITENSFFN
jgi:hypothetical protein